MIHYNGNPVALTAHVTVGYNTPTDSRTTLKYWYQYLVDKFVTYVEADGETVMERYEQFNALNLEYPKDTQKVTDFTDMFTIFYEDPLGSSTYRKTTAQVLSFTGTLDCSSATSLNSLFDNQKSLVDVGNIINTSKVTNFNYIFRGCSNLKTIPPLDTSSATMFYYTFNGCSKITTIPPLVTSNGTMFYFMFNGCSALQSIPQLDTSNGTRFDYMFNGCSALQSIPELDCRNATIMTNVVSGTKNLTSARFKNLKVSTQIGSGTSYGHLIVVDDLIFMIYHLRDTGSSQTFTVGSANLEKLANVYVRTIDITDAMRAEDDLIDEKLPFEVCESTDEGAVLITQYVSYKNWALK